jgi:hypothetical protein
MLDNDSDIGINRNANVLVAERFRSVTFRALQLAIGAAAARTSTPRLASNALQLLPRRTENHQPWRTRLARRGRRPRSARTGVVIAAHCHRDSSRMAIYHYQTTIIVTEAAIRAL